MSKKKKKTESLAVSDFKKVKSLVKKGTLDKVLSKLDAKDIRGTMKAVPEEVVRFMSHLLINIENVDKQVKVLKAEELIPIESLLKSARKYRGEEFAKRLFELAAEDEEFRRDYKLTVQKKVRRTDTKINNEIDQVYVVPHLMLQSKHLFTEISFLQDDELLFRWNSEIDDVLLMASRLIHGVSHCVELVQKDIKGLNPNVNVEVCLTYLDLVDQASKRIRRALPRFGRSSKKRGARRKSEHAAPPKTTRKRVKRKADTRG